jgi:hypothetical protein
MPIIEPVAKELPLSQGDLLQGISLYATGSNWGASGGESVQTAKSGLCLVVSRPCVARNKEHVTVVEVEQVRLDVPEEAKTFDDMTRFFSAIRDGAKTPDRLYLGELEGKTGRFTANLDSFHNLQVSNHSPERQQFVGACRIGRLHRDFITDLHARLFRAFASMGFDDVGWFSNQDLEIVVNAGRAELAALENARYSQGVAAGKKQLVGKTMPPSVQATACAKVDDMKERLKPFEAEHARRMNAMSDSPATVTTTSTTTTPPPGPA